MKQETKTLKPESLRKIDAYWRAANYLSVGQIYLYDNPLLKKPLKLAHIKPRLLGHWGTTPGLNFIYAHLNRVIKEHDLNVIYITGPGHGGPGLVANAWLEGTYSEVYPGIAQNEDGMKHFSTRSTTGPCCPLRIRVVNVVNLMKLQPQTEHPHGLSDRDFDALFTRDKPVIFAFHAYPWLIHRLTYRRANHDSIHVRGYKEEGTITTPFDMTVLNDLDRFHLVMDAIDRLPQTGDQGARLKRQLQDQLIAHKQYIDKHGEDLPEIRNWKWEPVQPAGPQRVPRDLRR